MSAEEVTVIMEGKLQALKEARTILRTAGVESDLMAPPSGESNS